MSSTRMVKLILEKFIRYHGSFNWYKKCWVHDELHIYFNIFFDIQATFKQGMNYLNQHYKLKEPWRVMLNGVKVLSLCHISGCWQSGLKPSFQSKLIWMIMYKINFTKIANAFLKNLLSRTFFGLQWVKTKLEMSYPFWEKKHQQLLKLLNYYLF